MMSKMKVTMSETQCFIIYSKMKVTMSATQHFRTGIEGWCAKKSD